MGTAGEKVASMVALPLVLSARGMVLGFDSGVVAP